MGPSKEFDELFQKMQHNDRTHEARTNSLQKLQDKVSKKKRHVAPIFISIVMVAVACFLVFTLINQSPNPTDHLAAEIENEDKNKAAIRAVLEKEFTGPDEEYLRILEELHRQQMDSSYDGYVGQDQPPDNTEYMAYIEETYASYFTENGLHNFIMTTPALMYHYNGSDVDYKMSISDIEVVQSDNPNAPKKYSFSAQVEYEDKNGETTQYKVNGDAICSEEGKIGKIFFHAAGLQEKINEDLNS